MNESNPGAIIAASLRRERTRAGLSLAELGRQSGVAKSTLSQLEQGGGNPNVETLWALARALDVPFSRLVDAQPQAIRVIRRGEGTQVRSVMADFSATSLASLRTGSQVSLYTVELEPGASRRAEDHLPGTLEHVVVTAGRLRVGPEDAPVDLGVGDYASFAGDVPHTYEALRKGTRVVLVMEHL